MLIWEELNDHCNRRFGPPIRDDILGELSKLRQTGYVEDYISQFKNLTAQTDDLTTKEEAHIFISGLKQYIAIDVKIQKLPGLSTVVHLARLYEQRNIVFNTNQCRSAPQTQ